MTWTCPLCGHENMKDPLNSRHKPKCDRCNEDMKTVAEIQDQINEQRADNQEIIQSEINRLNRAKEEMEHLKTELSWAQQSFDDSAKIISEARKELNRLDNLKIFRDIDRETKVQSDEKQRTGPSHEEGHTVYLEGDRE